MITLLNHLFSDYNNEEVLNIFSLTNRRRNKNVVNTEGQDLNTIVPGTLAILARNACAKLFPSETALGEIISATPPVFLLNKQASSSPPAGRDEDDTLAVLAAVDSTVDGGETFSSTADAGREESFLFFLALVFLSVASK